MKKLYNIHYYNLKIRSSLGAAAKDSVLEVTADGATVRKINRNETGKVYLSIKKLEQDELNKEIANYNIGKSKPSQVAGDDTVSDSPIIRPDEWRNRP